MKIYLFNAYPMMICVGRRQGEILRCSELVRYVELEKAAGGIYTFSPTGLGWCEEHFPRKARKARIVGKTEVLNA